VLEWQKDWKFRQLLYRSSRRRLRRGATSVHIMGPRCRRNGDHCDVYSLGACSSDQSRASTGTSSRRDWLCYWQAKIADLGRPCKVSVWTRSQAVARIANRTASSTFGVTWRHRSRDVISHVTIWLIPHMLFPIGSPLVRSVYLQPISRYCALVVLASRDHLIAHMSFPIGFLEPSLYL